MKQAEYKDRIVISRKRTGWILAAALFLFSMLALTGLSPTGAAAGFYYKSNFNGALGSRWSWVRPDPTHWSLTKRPGYLRLVVQYGGLLNWGNNARNVLLQKAPAGNFAIATRVEFTPRTDFQLAGILVYQDDDNFLQLGRAYCAATHPGCVGNGIYFDREEGGVFQGHRAISTTVTGNAFLKIVRQGATYRAFYGTDGTHWTRVGAWTMSSAFRPLKVGLNVSDGATWAPQIPADYDWFQVVGLP